MKKIVMAVCALFVCAAFSFADEYISRFPLNNYAQLRELFDTLLSNEAGNPTYAVQKNVAFEGSEWMQFTAGDDYKVMVQTEKDAITPKEYVGFYNNVTDKGNIKELVIILAAEQFKKDRRLEPADATSCMGNTAYKWYTGDEIICDNSGEYIKDRITDFIKSNGQILQGKEVTPMPVTAEEDKDSSQVIMSGQAKGDAADSFAQIPDIVMTFFASL